MVVGTNSMPAGTPSLGCGEGVNLIQCKELNPATVRLCISMAMELFKSNAALAIEQHSCESV